MIKYVCPFGKYCAYGHNKKYQPNGVCYHFWIGDCTEEHKKYDDLNPVEAMIISKKRDKALSVQNQMQKKEESG